MAKHNYPKERKPRCTEYSKTHKILTQLGEEQVRAILSHRGIYVSSRILSQLMEDFEVSPAVTYYMRKFKLKMEVNFSE